MRIGIDCRLAGKAHAGIGRYTEELVSRLVTDTSIDWTLFCMHANQLPISPAKNISIVHTPYRHYTLLEQVMMPQRIASAHLDLFHAPHLNVPLLLGVPFVVTIHDLLWHRRTNADATTLHPIVHLLKYQAYRLVVRQAVQRSRAILVPSRVVAEEIVQHFPAVDHKKIVVTPEGGTQSYEKRSNTARRSGMSTTLVYTGSLYPHKNISCVLKALVLLPAFTLKIISARSQFLHETLAAAKEAGVEERIEFLENLSDLEIAEIYSNALCLIQPSTAEGFGLTGIEAMLAGLPVIASDIPVFQEVYRDAFLPFNPADPASLAAAIQTIQKQVVWDQLVERGVTVASTYSWDLMTRQTLAVYQSALSHAH